MYLLFEIDQPIHRCLKLEKTPISAIVFSFLRQETSYNK